MKKIGLLLLSLSLMLGSCSSHIDPLGYEYYNKRVKQLRNMPIADAEALFVAGDGKTRADGDEAGALYKITYNGETERVEFKTEAGEVLNAQTVCVIDLSEKYVYVQIAFHEYVEDSNWNTFLYGLIVRKTDGAIYIYPNYFEDGFYCPATSCQEGFYYVSQADLLKHIRELHLRNQDITYSNYGLAYTQNDAMGNVYRNNHKITDNNGGETQVENLFGEHLDYHDGVVNPNGDIFLREEKVCRLNNGQYRTVTNNIPDNLINDVIFVLPFEPDDFYYIDYTDQYSEPEYGSFKYSRTYNLYKYTTADSEMEGRFVRQITTGDDWIANYAIYYLKDGIVAIVQENNKTLFANIRSEKDIRVVETNIASDLGNSSGNILTMTIPSDNYLYHRNENRISRIDPLTGTEKEVFADPGYKVIDYYVSAGDSVFVLTLELSSGNEILMEVSDDGTVTNLETYDGHRVFQLERIR